MADKTTLGRVLLGVGIALLLLGVGAAFMVAVLAGENLWFEGLVLSGIGLLLIASGALVRGKDHADKRLPN